MACVGCAASTRKLNIMLQCDRGKGQEVVPGLQLVPELVPG